MIKINLLPIRAARKREYVKQQLILFAVLVVGTIIGLYMWYSSLAGKIEQEKKDIVQIQAQIEQYKKAIGKVEEYKGLEAMLNQRLKTIEDLVKGKTGPVRVLDHLSQIIPKQVWLTKWEEKSGSVDVSGEALSHKHVALFLSALEQTLKVGGRKEAAAEPAPGGTAAAEPVGFKVFTNVDLLEAKMLQENRFGQSFVGFKLRLNVTYAI